MYMIPNMEIESVCLTGIFCGVNVLTNLHKAGK